jgi:two-component system, OmpR family, sensor kinase
MPQLAVAMDALQRLMAIQAVELRPALVEAADAIVAATGAEKVDIFLHDPPSGSLHALGVSRTPVGEKQRALGLDRLPVVNGGRAAVVFATGAEFMTGDAVSDPEELPAIVRDLGIRSHIAVPLEIAGARRGVLSICSTVPNAFPDHLLGFARAAAQWIGVMAHRAEIVERLAVEASDRARRQAAEQLITIVAHDLRNYIAPIHGRIVLIKQRAIRERHRAHERDAEAAERALKRLANLLSSLLDVGRIEQGLFEVHLAPTELVTLVREVAGAIQIPNVPITIRGEPEIVVDADAPKLRQALENLLSNASKYSPAGAPVVVDVTACELADGTAQAFVLIEDQGPGMDADLASRVFTRFARGAASQGLGLGLYLAREIVSAHHGTLDLSTAPGRGARFTLRLPAHVR